MYSVRDYETTEVSGLRLHSIKPDDISTRSISSNVTG